jgi:hypothetical protein
MSKLNSDKNEVLAAKCEVCGDFPILMCEPHFYVQCSCGSFTQYRKLKCDAIVDWLMCKTYKRKSIGHNALLSLEGFLKW